MRWWSKSKKDWQEIDEMILPHAKNALEKLARGEYAPAPSGEPLSAGEERVLRSALEKRIAELEEAWAREHPEPPETEVA